MKKIILFLIILLNTGCNNTNSDVFIDDKITQENVNEQKTKEDNNFQEQQPNKDDNKNERKPNETEDTKFEFTNFIANKLVKSIKNENYGDLKSIFIGLEDIKDSEKMISNLLNNYKTKFDLETITYEYTGEIIRYEEVKDVPYYKYRIYDNEGNQHFVEIGVISNTAQIRDEMFNSK